MKHMKKHTKKRRKTMTLPNIDVLAAKSSMTDLIGHAEHIRMDPELASNNGIVVGQQVRIYAPSEKYAIYTITEMYQDGDDDNDVRMAADGRARVDETNGWSGEPMNPVALSSGLTEAQLVSNSEYGEFLTESDTEHTGLVICAPHGGYIENYTDEIAERIYTYLSGKDRSCWTAKGFISGGGAYDAWHITSTEISRMSFPKLDQIGDRGFSYAISIHGYSEAEIAIGGNGPTALKEALQSAIYSAVEGNYDVDLVTSGPYAGTDSANFVNWLQASGQGIQIEIPSAARSSYWEAIADAIGGVYAALL